MGVGQALGNLGALVNGDEVRDTRFLSPTGRFTRGYGAAEVDELLGRIAAELDAGRQVGSLIENATFRTRTGTQGYDAQAVDWFTRSGPGDLAGRTATPPRRAHRKDRAQDRECLARECADAWRDFGQQPGTQLRWVLTSGRHLWSVLRGELYTAEQQAGRLCGHLRIKDSARCPVPSESELLP